MSKKKNTNFFSTTSAFFSRKLGTYSFNLFEISQQIFNKVS